MDTPPTAKNWRLNAAAIIMDAEGCVLLGKDSGRNPYWHFPQGGVIKHESIEQTLAREVWEEVGLRPTEYTIVSRLPGLRYKYPSNNRKPTFLCAAKPDALKRICTAAPNFQKRNGFPSRISNWKCSPNSKGKSSKTPFSNSSGPAFLPNMPL